MVQSRPTISVSALSRRVAIALGFALPFGANAAAEQGAPRSARGSDTLARLVRRADESNSAFMRGDMEKWFELVSPIAEDFTLMQPFGGPPSRGFDGRRARLEQLARTFRNGEGVLELVQAYESDDIVVLVMIERQHGEVGGLPDQDWSLRVTQVYRRQDDKWQIVHRHADPLVRNIGLERTAAIARG